MAEVFAVYLEFTDKHRSTGLSCLEKVLRRAFPKVRHTIVVVDNALDGDLERELSDGTNVISGDNSQREFSGYGKGLAWLEKRKGLCDPKAPVVLANDTFHRSYGAKYLSKFTAHRVAQGLAEGGLIGHVDSYPRSVRLMAYELKDWVRTSFLITRYGTLSRLLPLTLEASDKEIFSKNPLEFFAPEAPLSSNYKEYIRTWLFDDAKPDAEFRYEWHSKTRLTRETSTSLKDKARCILCEHQLSAKARELGIPLVDIEKKG